MNRDRVPAPALRVVPGISPPVCPPPSTRPRAYEVRIRETVGEAVWIIGHDRRGEPMMEMRIAKRHLSSKMIRGMEHWCRQNDGAPEISIEA